MPICFPVESKDGTTYTVIDQEGVVLGNGVSRLEASFLRVKALNNIMEVLKSLREVEIHGAMSSTGIDVFAEYQVAYSNYHAAKVTKSHRTKKEG